MAEKEKNIGYTITKKIVVEGVEFVLGVKSGIYPQYATWQHHNGNYFCGSFFYERLNAERNLYNRVIETIDLAQLTQVHKTRNLKADRS